MKHDHDEARGRQRGRKSAVHRSNSQGFRRFSGEHEAIAVPIPAEQDNRTYAGLWGCPASSPPRRRKPKDMTREALLLAELSSQVMLRTTTRVNHLRGPVAFGRSAGRHIVPFEHSPCVSCHVPAVAQEPPPGSIKWMLPKGNARAGQKPVEQGFPGKGASACSWDAASNTTLPTRSPKAVGKRTSRCLSSGLRGPCRKTCWRTLCPAAIQCWCSKNSGSAG